MVRTILILILISFFLIQCGEKKAKDVLLTANKEFTTINDTIYFARIEAMQIYKNNILFSDYKLNKIFRVDNDFHFLNSIGKSGNGPKEFNGLKRFEIVKDTIIAYQESGKKFKFFTMDGKYLSEFSSQVGRVFSSTFAVDSNFNIYISTPHGENPISVINRKGEVVNRFGNWFIPEKKWQKRERNSRFLKIDADGNLICVYITEPIIEKYSLDGELLSRMDLKSNSYIKNRIDYIEKKYNDEKENPMVGSLYTLFRWIEIKGDYLYLLHSSGKGNNNILLIENSADKFIFKENIKLKNEVIKPYIKTFSINNEDEVIAYDTRKGSFYTFSKIKDE